MVQWLRSLRILKYTHSGAFKEAFRDFPGGEDTALPIQGMRARSLVGELRSHMLQGN